MNKMTNHPQHWTAITVDNFVAQVAADFTLQLEKKLDNVSLSKKEFAGRLELSEGRVSQVFNNPCNFKLTTMTEFARALNMKVAVVAYEDGDPDNTRGPINSEVFYECWKRAGQPQDFSDLRASGLVFRPAHYHFDPIYAVNDKENKRRLELVPQKASTAA